MTIFIIEVTYTKHDKTSNFNGRKSGKYACSDYHDCMLKAKKSCDASSSCNGYFIPRNGNWVYNSHHRGYYLCFDSNQQNDGNWELYKKN